MVLGNDLVSRLNFPALCRLRNDVLDAISRAKVNKMVVLGSIFKDVEPSDLMYARGEEPDSEFKQSVAKYKVSGMRVEDRKNFTIPFVIGESSTASDDVLFHPDVIAREDCSFDENSER